MSTPTPDLFNLLAAMRAEQRRIAAGQSPSQAGIAAHLAFETLIRRSLLTVRRRYPGIDPVDAADAASTIITELYCSERVNLPRVIQHPIAYLATAIMREATATRRRANVMESPKTIARVYSTMYDPAERASAAEDSRIDEVRRALESLPVKHADILRWWYIDEVPTPIIAKKLGISEAGVNQRVNRARAALRVLLGIPKPRPKRGRGSGMH
jgi:RNA polymerase sigma factor (sigma-70 family)